MPKITRYGGVSYAAPLADESAVASEAPAAAAEPAPAMTGPTTTTTKTRKDATVTPETARGRHERTDGP